MGNGRILRIIAQKLACRQENLVTIIFYETLIWRKRVSTSQVHTSIHMSIERETMIFTVNDSILMSEFEMKPIVSDQIILTKPS